MQMKETRGGNGVYRDAEAQRNTLGGLANAWEWGATRLR